MMAFLLKQTKEVLLEVAIDLGVEVNSTLTKSEIKNRICQSEDYNEESVKSLLEGILAENREARELKENRETREFEERKLIRAFELERMKLANSTDTISVASTDLEGQGVNRRVNLRDLVPKFDAKNADINLFFEIFERQAKKEKVAEDRRVSQLIPLLPIEIAEIVAKEPLEKSDDYPHIKNLLLARFQLTPIALRDRFESHQRRPGAMWADLVFELRSYLDNWLAGMKVGDFAALKELLVTEQLKKRAPSELVDHFLDSWDGFKEAKSLAEKLDHFEAIRRVHKKTGPMKTWERRTFDKQPPESKNKSAYFSIKGKNIGPLNRDPYKHEGGEDDSFIIPAFEGEGGKSLAKVNGVEFKEEQRKCPDLKPFWDKALTGIDKEFRVIREKLVRVAKTKRGEEVRQLCVPIKDVEEFVKTCDSCQRVGKPRDKAKAPLKLVPIISEVFSKINIDAVGPLPVSTKQNRYLITSICVASKYPEAIPVESITSPNVIDALLSIFSRLGFPREIQSDMRTSFTSELTTTFFNKFGIKMTRSSVSYPQSNAVERVHRTIKHVIKALCVESGEDWEGVLPLALFSLRTVAHESTGFSPTELVMGKNFRTPQTLVYEEWMEEGNTSQLVVEYILQLNNRLKRCQDIAITRMKECQLKRKTWYDRDAVERKFVEGDLVMVLATSKQNKLEVNWIGPGKVLSRISNTNYVIDLPGRRDRSTIYHVNLLKPYHRRLELVSLVVEEVSDDIEGDAEIPYPDKQCTKFDYHEILRESQLQLKLSPSQIDELKQVITKNKDVFSPDPGTTHLMRMDIELISDKPIKTKPYRMSPRQINKLREEIKRLLELGVIEIGQSDYTSPLILEEIPNKDPRPCVDYRIYERDNSS
ncbi:retrovirus-related Pol polyprotein from transposon 412 [Trichonephila clavipes]|uniref:Retrovirus-related Pol polyprotein from transposon 412 n=1 Tax=Trichonephila clavipes TaxID=2585209 RepID=A0A8X6VTV0_TRICX|nr:retrovirus-related Pol polyprotein from transposon 412 [Trichonephila clavipes]